MKSWKSIRRLVLGFALVAAFSAVPVFAAGPTVSDSGSAYWTARVDGSGFTRSGFFSTNYAYVQIDNYAIDYNGNVVETVVGDSVAVSGMLCARIFCTVGGTFHYERYMAPLQCYSRWARAYDYASGLWSPWVQLDCA